MKKVIIPLFCIFQLWFNTPVCAETHTADRPVEIPIRTKSNTHNHPHDDVEAVLCYYSNGVLSFYFESYEGRADITVTNAFTGESFTQSASTASSPVTVVVGSTPGTYLISITTSKNAYEGWFVVE